MNVFFLDVSPVKAAQMQCDRHVVKMILESAQLLSTAHRELDGDNWADANGLYKSTHKNHPSAIWARESKHNYDWLYDHFYALCDEYRYRYGKEHKSWTKLGVVLKNRPVNIMRLPFDFYEPPQCMPDKYKVGGDSVQAYRNYYAFDKASNDWFGYKKSRPAPSFLVKNTCSYPKEMKDIINA